MIAGKVEIDRASRRAVERIISEFVKATGKTAEEGVQMIAYSAAKRLVHTVQPFGMEGAEFVRNIGRQIDQVRWEVNVGAMPPNDIRSAHNAARKNGRLRLRSTKLSDIKYYKNIISEQEAARYAKQQQRKAGRAKAAWVTAGNKIGKPNLRGIPHWIKRHVGSKYGDCEKSGEGLNHKVTLVNSTPYMTTRMQPNEYIIQAAEDGLKNGLKRLQKIIDKEIEKANRAMQ